MREASGLLVHPSHQEVERQRKLKVVINNARRWMGRASAIGLDERPGEREVAHFRGSLEELGSDSSPFRWSMNSVLNRALHSVVIHAMDAPQAAAAVPPSFYRQLQSRYLPYKQSKIARDGGFWEWRVFTHFHEMLGYQRSCQDAASVDAEAVLLLQLDTDGALDMDFGDVGSAYFWIKPSDLRARRFHWVWADVIGH